MNCYYPGRFLRQELESLADWSTESPFVGIDCDASENESYSCSMYEIEADFSS